MEKDFQEWWDDSGIHMTPGDDPMYTLEDWYQLFKDIYKQGHDDCYERFI